MPSPDKSRCPRCSRTDHVPADTPAGPGCTRCARIPYIGIVAGACTRCRAETTLYGPHSTGTLCPPCRAALPTPPQS